MMKANPISPGALSIRLVVYFCCLIGLFYSIVTFTPWAPYLPVGGHDLDLPGTAQNIFEVLNEEGGGLLG
ncbi:MAG: hypothetical protein ACR2QQ_07220 [Gammaproteobacteria bacterium]